jgi:hypothetical protein
MLKKYDPNDNAPERQFVGMEEHEYGEWYKVDDVEAILNSAQLLKAEILKLKKEKQLDKEYCDEGEGVRGYNEAIDDVISKLSGV